MMDLAAASPLARRLLAIITLAPRRANSNAVSRPMPPLPPMITKNNRPIIFRTNAIEKVTSLHTELRLSQGLYAYSISACMT